MIKATYYRYGMRHRFTVEGHAGHSEAGTDIVCAGVSAVSYALLGFLRHERAVCREEHRSGYLMVDSTGGESVESAYTMALIGILQIQQKYPQCVEVHIDAQGV